MSLIKSESAWQQKNLQKVSFQLFVLRIVMSIPLQQHPYYWCAWLETKNHQTQRIIAYFTQNFCNYYGRRIF